MDIYHALLSIGVAAGIVSGSSVYAYILQNFKSEELISPPLWSICLLAGSGLIFYFLVQYMGWKQAPVFAIALLLGALLGSLT